MPTQVSALSQLELCLAYQRHWCDHKPSITVTVQEEEWLDVGAWVYKHFGELSGEQQQACWLLAAVPLAAR
jgi:ribonucleoside-triphosphate reductase